jgi:hypothetical protein
VTGARSQTAAIVVAESTAQQVNEGCFVIVTDGIARAWYEPITLFSGGLFVGDSVAGFSGSYIGSPLILSVGSVQDPNSSPPTVISIFTLDGFALVNFFFQLTVGFWLPQCDIERPDA